MLMKNKKGLIMGVANDRSIAWGIAKNIADQGGSVAFTYQGDALLKRVKLFSPISIAAHSCNLFLSNFHLQCQEYCLFIGE